MQPEKLWLFYDMKRMSEWRIGSTTTSWVTLKKERKSWCYLARDHDRIGCFTNQVKLTRALVWDLDEAISDFKLLGEHEEESSQKVTELEALCKKLREDTCW
jgi:hypothetical protein